MKILAMDTALPQGGAALLEGERLVGGLRFGATSGHAMLLPQAVQQLLAEAHWTMPELGLVTVTSGPGSFTGVRIALGMAKGMALARGTPVTLVTTLAALAAGAAAQTAWSGGLVASVLDARRGELYAALYQQPPGGAAGWELAEQRAPALWRVEELLETLAEEMQDGSIPLLVAGNGLVEYATQFRKRLGANCRTTPPDCWAVDPAVVGHLGRHRYRRAGATLPLLLEPIYLRRPEAERNASEPMTEATDAFAAALQALLRGAEE